MQQRAQRPFGGEFSRLQRILLVALLSFPLACSSKDDDDAPPPAGGSAGSPANAGAAGNGAAHDAGGTNGGAGSPSGTAGASGRGAGGAGATGGTSAGGTAGGSASAGMNGGAGRAAAGNGTGGTSAGGSNAGAGGTSGAAGASGAGGEHSVEATCARWNADRADMGEGTWSGDVMSCDAGDISADGRANALKLVNLYRWLAELPAVGTSDDRNQLAQACSLVMDANGMLSHDPPMDWDCWTEDAHEGASTSNISSGPGVSSIDLYLVDTGNEDTLGHRRWVLSNSLGPIGLGSTGPTGASCMQNLTGESNAGKQWLAWPPPGVFPAQAFKPGRFGGSLDDTGWSIQSDKLKLDSATVTVTSAGSSLPVTVTKLPGGYGSSYALSFKPDGWHATAGMTYSVAVAGTTTPIAYDVSVVDCAP